MHQQLVRTTRGSTFSMSSCITNRSVPPLRACELPVEPGLASPAAASMLAPAANMAMESQKRFCM